MRGRPALAKGFSQSVADQSAHPEAAETVLYVDEDDVESHHLDHPDIRDRKNNRAEADDGGLRQSMFGAIPW